MSEPSAKPVWWVMEDRRLSELLCRAAAGEDPDSIYIEEYVNANIEHAEGSDDLATADRDAVEDGLDET